VSPRWITYDTFTQDPTSYRTLEPETLLGHVWQLRRGRGASAGRAETALRRVDGERFSEDIGALADCDVCHDPLHA